MIKIVGVCTIALIGSMCINGILGINKAEQSTDKITTAIEYQTEQLSQPIVIDNSNNDDLKMIQKQLSTMQEEIEKSNGSQEVIVVNESPKTSFSHNSASKSFQTAVCNGCGNLSEVSPAGVIHWQATNGNYYYSHSNCTQYLMDKEDIRPTNEYLNSFGIRLNLN